MSQVNATTESSLTPTPQMLRRNRLLLIGGVVTILPAAAFLPSVLAPRDRQSITPLLAAVDEMTASTSANAGLNERAVEMTDAKAQATAAMSSAHQGLFARSAKPQATPIASAQVTAQRDPETLRWFNGRPVRPARTMSMLVTAYSPDAISCGESADGITASGYSVWTNGMKLVAADTNLLPFGTLISVPGYDDANVVPVLDRGGAIKGHRLDVLYPTNAQAAKWGAQRLDVIVWEYADGAPGDFEIQRALAARQ